MFLLTLVIVLCWKNLSVKVRIDGIPTNDLDDSLPGVLPNGNDDAPKRKGGGGKKGGKKAPKVKVTIPSPLGLSFKSIEDGSFIVTKVKAGGNTEATGQVTEGMQIVTVNGTVLKGLEKADVVTIIRAGAGEATLELRASGGGGGGGGGSSGGSGVGGRGGSSGAGAPPSFDASQAEDAKKGATGDANHGEFRHSVLDAVLAGDDSVLKAQMGLPEKKDPKAKKTNKGKIDRGLTVTIPSPLGFSFKQDANGFLVTKVKEGGNAEASGKIQAEMRIITVNGSPVEGREKAAVTDMIKSASAADGKVTVQFAPPIAGSGGGGSTSPPARNNIYDTGVPSPPARNNTYDTGVPSSPASPKKAKKEKKAKSNTKGGKKASTGDWNAMRATKEEALGRIRGKVPGSFVIRATDKAAAALSVIKPDGKM